MKKLILLLVTLALLAALLALGACAGGGDSTTETRQELQDRAANGGTASPQQGQATGTRQDGDRDLGGMVINIATWWSDVSTDTVEPRSAAERARWEDRRAMEERYNFKIREVRYGSWHDVRDEVQQQILAQNRDFQVWVIEPTWFATNHRQRLFAPIPEHLFENDYGIEWNHSLIDLTKRDGVPHGFAHGVEMAGGVYFNKRLLEDAGLPRDYPFTLQAEGNWTWETFTDLARQLSRDLDGDDIIDTWALTTFHKDFLEHALASNGASFATVDPETGMFTNNTNTDAFRETIDWLVRLRSERLAMHEDDIGGEWDSFIQMFNDGQGAMRVAGNYVAGNITLRDDWGFVAFPRGPRSDTHNAWVSYNVHVIPQFYSEQEVDDIMFAMSKWIRPLEDDDPDDWMDEAFSNHRDERSVEDTMVKYTRNPDLQTMPAHMMMSGLGDTLDTLFAFKVWVDGNDASVIIEEGQLVWDAFLDDLNSDMR
ncbi:MAG: extracellular solute-binding protein [Defluviitaleaceae bacterium]|nr:extracellular solute-binding protein [Defluviitaleaceae bacterium]